MVFDSASEIAIVAVYLVWLLILPLVLGIKKQWREYADENMLYIPPLIFTAFGFAGLVLEFFLRYRYPGYRANSNEALELYLYLALFGTVLWQSLNLAVPKKDKPEC